MDLFLIPGHDTLKIIEDAKNDKWNKHLPNKLVIARNVFPKKKGNK